MNPPSMQFADQIVRKPSSIYKGPVPTITEAKQLYGTTASPCDSQTSNYHSMILLYDQIALPLEITKITIKNTPFGQKLGDLIVVLKTR